MPTTPQEPTTLLEAVRASLAQAGRHDPGDVVPPAAVLWTDADGQWLPVVEHLRSLMPELLTLGEFNPQTRTGPAIWLRCVIERALPDAQLPAGAIPVIYMPNVSRQVLRAGEECPEGLTPLVELQYRGTVWTQKNGKDWTVQAFLVSEDGGLGLDVARGGQTQTSMLGALTQLAVTPISRLRDRRLEAEDFDKLMIGDAARDLLLWMSDGPGVRAEWDEKKWAAFRSRCGEEYGFDPETDGEIVAGERLGLRKDAWVGVWERFAESPGLYPGVPGLLRRAKPLGLFVERDAWPDENDEMEVALRNALVELRAANSHEARQRIGELETQHGIRRGWVWAKLGQCPLAEAMKHLAVLAKRTMATLGGQSADVMAKLYAEGEYLADDAALDAMAAVKSAEDADAVAAAVRTMYLPWLDDTARHFQECVASVPLPGAATTKVEPVGSGECILFADALRFDVAQRLVAAGEARQLRATCKPRWAALPTVTATAKHAASPVADKLTGHRLGEDFLPVVAESDQALTTDRFRKLLAEEGYQVLGPSETGEPRAEGARGWTEGGELDKLGHTLQAKLAARIGDQVELLLERIRALLGAGWKKVRVVTDHGWLLVPGGLPAVKLPKYLTECRWARCAAIKGTATPDAPTARWHWNAQEHFAFGPGVHCFGSGNDYAHGGLSLQECLVPELTFALDEAAVVAVAIQEVKWTGMRCRVQLDAAGAKVTVDLRTKPNDSGSSICTPKAVDAEGRASLVVPNDSLEGDAVCMVVLDPSGRVVAKRATTVGGEE